MKTINELNNFDKPREKLLAKGAQSLKDYELVAILLGSGIKGKDVIKLSKEIVKLFEDDFLTLDLNRLLDIHGLGVAKASQIISAIELSKRHLIKQNKKISNAKDIYDELSEYHNKKQEYFLCIYLDGANHICVNSLKATKFRQWATRVLKQYITNGYAINSDKITHERFKELN